LATARKMTVLAWHLVTKDQDYAFARPGLVAHKRRSQRAAFTIGHANIRNSLLPDTVTTTGGHVLSRPAYWR
jgi:hypothetical protein